MKTLVLNFKDRSFKSLIYVYITSFFCFVSISTFDLIFQLTPYYIPTFNYFFLSLVFAFLTTIIIVKLVEIPEEPKETIFEILRFSIGSYLSFIALLALDFILEMVILELPEQNDFFVLIAALFALFLGYLFIDNPIYPFNHKVDRIIKFFRWSIAFYVGLIFAYLNFIRIGGFFPDITSFAAITGIVLSIITGIISYILLKFRESEKKAKMNEEKYRMLINLSPDAIFSTNPSGTITMVNQECINMFEYNNQSDMIGLKASTLFNDDNGVKLDEGNTDENSLFRNEKLYAKTKKGNIFPTELSSSFFLNEKDEITGFVIIIRDISEREKLDQLQERFIAMTSHELRTPVHIIQGYVEFLNSKTEISPSRQKNILNNLERSINRLLRLVNAFHDVSAIKSDQFTITKSEESVSTFISLLYSQCRKYQRMIFVTIKPEISSINTLIVDLDRVLQVLDNLCSNAIKNSSEESTIEITITYEMGLLKLIVTDTGVGIPIKHLTNLFQPFSHKSSKYSVSGTGLGLFIVKQIVLSHKGTLFFQTQENNGTTVCVSFPINET